jgi:hypothetical protein
MTPKKKVKVVLNGLTTQSEVDLMMQSAAATLGFDVSLANVTLDYRGKHINLEIVFEKNEIPEGLAQELKDYINTLLGVDKTLMLPAGGRIEDFESLGAAGTVVTSNLIALGEAPFTANASMFAVDPGGGPSCEFVISADGEGTGGGAGNALEIKDNNNAINQFGTDHLMSGGIGVNPAPNGYTSINAVEMKMKVKLKYVAALSDSFQQPAYWFTTSIGSLKCYKHDVGGVDSGLWRVQFVPPPGFVLATGALTQTMAFVDDQYEDMALKIDPVTGNTTWSFGSVSGSGSAGLNGVGAPGVSITTRTQFITDPGTHTQDSQYIDDLEINILDAN